MGTMKTLTINGATYNIVPVVPASSVTLLASEWVSEAGTHYQVVNIPGVTAHSKIDLQPTAEQLAEFHYKVLGFVAENDGGVVTVYAIGDRPANDHTMQVTVKDVDATGKIRGNTVGTTTPRADLSQSNPAKADYVLGKETFLNDALQVAKESGQFDGLPGEDGYSPVKGTDYWTNEDINEILADCDNHIATELAKLDQISPEFAQSIAACIDTSKLYVLPDGFIYAYFRGEDVRPLFVNQIPISVDNDGSVYNGVGYKEGVRWSTSSKAEAEFDGAFLTGWIQVEDGDIVRIKNMPINKGSSYVANQNNVAMANASRSIQWNFYTTTLPDLTDPSFDAAGNLIQFTVPLESGAKWIRFTAQNIDENSIVTVNEEIVWSGATETGWQNTGHAFVPADYESRIVALEKALLTDMHIYGIVDSGNNIIVTGALAAGTYTMKYQHEDGSTTDIGTFTME